MSQSRQQGTYHGLDVGMRYRLELLEVQLQLVSDIDVGALVLGGVTVPWCGED